MISMMWTVQFSVGERTAARPQYLAEHDEVAAAQLVGGGCLTSRVGTCPVISAIHQEAAPGYNASHVSLYSVLTVRSGGNRARGGRRR